MSDPLAALRLKFRLRCREDLAALRGAGDPSALGAVVHRIAGVAGIFGYDELGDLARRLDEGVRATGRLRAEDLTALEGALLKACPDNSVPGHGA